MHFKGELQSGQEKGKLNAVLADVVALADSSSQIIYVYPFTKTRFKSEKKKSGSKIPETKVVNVNQVTAHFLNTPIERFSEFRRFQKRLSRKGRIEIMIGLRPVVSWAVRIEGEINPIDKTFQSKDEAYDYASKLKKKGEGKKIVISK